MNRFKQIEQLGSGAYGVAVLVEEKSTHQKYVVKIMQLTKLPPEAQKSARGEISVLARLQHKNIVRYYDSFDENRCLHIVMEYCDGGDLERRMKQGGRLSELQIWDYFVQICLALKYLHSKKVLHRDIKPANIFLTKKDEVKLGDFGVSKSLQNTLDMASTFAGTPVYLPPEMCNNQDYNDKCDMWSLGVILYEMASGTLPFLAPNLLMLAQVIMRAHHKPLPPSYSQDLQITVDLLLQKNPLNRPSAAALLERPLIKTISRRFLSEPELQKELVRQVPHVPRYTGKPGFLNTRGYKHKYRAQVTPPGGHVASVDLFPVDSINLHRGRLQQNSHANPPSVDVAGADKPPPLQPKPQRYKSEPEKKPTLYEELLQLGDSIDIENVDFDEATWFPGKEGALGEEGASGNPSPSGNDESTVGAESTGGTEQHGASPFMESLTELENYMNECKEFERCLREPKAEVPQEEDFDGLHCWENFQFIPSDSPGRGSPSGGSRSADSSSPTFYDAEDTIIGQDLLGENFKEGTIIGSIRDQSSSSTSEKEDDDSSTESSGDSSELHLYLVEASINASLAETDELSAASQAEQQTEVRREEKDEAVADVSVLDELTALAILDDEQEAILPAEDKNEKDNMHTLFTPAEPKDKGRDFGLYDEMLAYALYNRELEQAGLKPKP